MSQEIWLFQKGYYAIHVIDAKLKRKIEFLKNFKLITSYFYPNGLRAWDFIVPAEMYSKAIRLLKMRKD